MPSASYLHFNRRGDVVAQTSGNAVVGYQAAYEAFGTHARQYGSDADRQRANTKEEDPTGLLDEGRRYRDLEAGVFLTRDPAGMVDGPNLYTYVKQNPWTSFDPEGLSAIEAAAKAAEDELVVGGRSVIHAEWAGKTIKPSELPKGIPGKDELAKKYPEGVRYTEQGRPDFTPYVREGSNVSFDEGVLTGEMAHDVPLARSALQQKGITEAQIAEMEKLHTWHHVEGGQELELVPSDLHDAYKHTGGRADIKSGNWFTRGVASLFMGVFANTYEAREKGGSVTGGLIKDGVGMTDAGLIAAPAEIGSTAGHIMNQQVERARSKTAEDNVRRYHSGIPELDRMNAENLRSLQGNQ